MRIFTRTSVFFLISILFLPSQSWSEETVSETKTPSGTYYHVDYSPSTQEGELVFGVAYTLWIPEGVTNVRAVIVHQHGCGTGACKGGETAAYDLHWQALAKKWNCALLGPSYHQDEGANCRLWCDPRNGSEKTFLRCLNDFADKSGHTELKSAPWCLWGHSGGGFWSSIMQTLHPERIVAIWFRSGTAYEVWEREEIPKPNLSTAMYEIPMVCNPGFKEKDDKRFNSAWTGAMAMFRAYRAAGAPICFAPDPRTAHECGDSRYLAIPFFDVCLEARLPQAGADPTKLRPIDQDSAWLASVEGTKAEPRDEFHGELINSVWLPNESFAKAWEDYVKTGAVADATPPAAPTNVRVSSTVEGKRTIVWEAEADFESGLQGFVLLRDGQEIARVPDKPIGRFGRALFQSMSYHDTPEQPLPKFEVVDSVEQADKKHEYQVISINSVGLKSKPSAPAK